MSQATALLEKIVELGLQDIYTDSPDFSGRVASMKILMVQAEKALKAPRIFADNDTVVVQIKGEEEFRFSAPGMLTGSDLRDVLSSLDVDCEYIWAEDDCDCDERSWQGEGHDTACPCHPLN